MMARMVGFDHVLHIYILKADFNSDIESSTSVRALLTEDFCQIVEGLMEYLKIRLLRYISVYECSPQSAALFPQIGTFKATLPTG